MKVQPQEKIIKCYNDTANNYAAERIDELSKKPFDRLLLKEFASVNKDKGLCADFGCGQFLFSFHVGNEIVHFDKAGDIDVDVDLFFFQPEQIIELLHETGFKIIDVLERYPYEDVEYASKRGYIWTEKK